MITDLKKIRPEKIPDDFIKEVVRTYPQCITLPASRKIPAPPESVTNYQNKKCEKYFHNVKIFRNELIERLLSDHAAKEIFSQELNLSEKYAQKIARRNELTKEKEIREKLHFISEYVNTHTEEISEYVNRAFHKEKECIRSMVFDTIRAFFSDGMPEHYEWKKDYNPYDCSGIIVEDGHVDASLTVHDFLNHEYNGRKRATFVSGMGWQYDTYGDELSEYTIEFGWNIMKDAIHDFVKQKLNRDLNAEEMDNLQRTCDNFDPIYDSSLTSNFFLWEGVWQFLDEPQLTIQQLISNTQS